MSLFLLMTFFLVNKGFCAFYTAQCVIFTSKCTKMRLTGEKEEHYLALPFPVC